MILVEWQSWDAERGVPTLHYERHADMDVATRRYFWVVQHSDVLRTSLLTVESEKVNVQLVTNRPNAAFERLIRRAALKNPGWSYVQATAKSPPISRLAGVDAGAVGA